MLMKRNLSVCALVALLGIVCCVSQAKAEITLLESNYQVEVVAQYQISNPGGYSKCIATDDAGVIYVNHDTSITRVDPDGTVSQLAGGFQNARGFTCGAGTAYGNYLYVADVYANGVKQIDTSTGNGSTFSALPEQPLAVQIDRTGNYGNQLYAGTRNSTLIYSISETGLLSEFVNLDAANSTGLLDIAFDTSGRYGGYMYITLQATNNSDYQGILAVDPQGNVSQFLSGGYWGGRIMFDSTETLDFGGDLFGGGIAKIERITPDGERVEFLTTDKNVQGYTFGLDGAMYVMEVDSFTASTQTITMNKITLIPEPATLVLLGLGAIGLIRRK